MFPQDLTAISPNADQKLYFTGNASWLTWNKPLGKNYAFMLCIGGAAGGGGGGTSHTTGGGGGGSGGIARLFVPLFLLPNTLYIQVGAGGAGGSAGNAGTGGAKSYICTIPTTPGGTPLSANTLLVSGHTAATTGGGGTASAGSAGAGEVIATVAADCQLAAIGSTLFVAGVAGIIGGSAAAGGNITALATIPLTGGASGAGSAAAGGNVTGAGEFPTITGGTGGASPTAGGSGYYLQGGATAFASVGGAGGGGTATAATTGGAGGNGGLGSGGGGGGGSASSTGGAGGKGGDGFIGIWCV
jgi:hypothetical protein